MADLKWKDRRHRRFRRRTGVQDLVWRNFATGANAIWKGGNSATPIAMTAVTLAWQVQRVADFDGDGARRPVLAQYRHRREQRSGVRPTTPRRRR
jgi:hypothetical protein